MFNKIKTRIIAFVTRRPNTDNAISAITKAIDELHAVADAESARAEVLGEQRRAVMEQLNASFAARGRALRIADRFSALVEE